jgi:hypothetical protein
LRKSIALLLTLIFITIVLGIVGGIIGIYKKLSKSNFEKEISQNSILIRDIKNILDNIVNDINDTKILYNTFPITNKDGSFRALIKIKPLLDKVDINEYLNKEKEKYIDRFLDNILEYYQVNDPLFFKALLKDTIDKDDIERIANSEIKLKNSFFKNGKIYNYSHFKKILDYYAKITKDESVYNIPWKSLIYFGDKESIIDCDIINNKVAKFLGLIYNEEYLGCKELKAYEENKKILQKLSIIPFNKKISYLVNVEIDYNDVKLNIFYNINKKRIENIKSNFLY